MSITGLVYFVGYVLALGMIVWLLTWLVDYINPPEPFHRVLKVVIVVVGVIILILLLLNMIGAGPAITLKP